MVQTIALCASLYHVGHKHWVGYIQLLSLKLIMKIVGKYFLRGRAQVMSSGSLESNLGFVSFSCVALGTLLTSLSLHCLTLKWKSQ